ncbi:MAG: tetratricopeptide repeat protein [Candidatus Acididesulfobacter diazotrophicus]|uniref:Tetratricopeptide repeat protein n=1 Tax=Candidatus Acididesulfobacter diazotrophicus TaxID=2597226 RepID=A0A519BJV7_9DELT|nr:MAG: tetratricopeptide repeat protein [Candidatus Acididesulfobacter diazotrophicus]
MGFSGEVGLNKLTLHSLNKDKNLNAKNKNKKRENKNGNGNNYDNEFKCQYKKKNGNESGVISSTFKEFDKIDNANYSANSNVEENKAYNYMNSKFFDILNLWEIRTNNYYTKDEIFFMSALFITNEYIPVLINIRNYTDYDYICDINSKDKNNIKNNNSLSLNLHNNSKSNGNGNFINRNLIYSNDNYFDGNENIHKNNDIPNIIKINYSNALKFFKKAIELNPCNPNYYYEYAECLKKSGKAKDAETFFKKAFESAL